MRDVQVRGGYVLHIGTVEGCLKVGDRVLCTIDGVREKSHSIMYIVYPPHCIHTHHHMHIHNTRSLT